MPLLAPAPFDTRLGRRLLGSFLICALLPVSALAVLSLRSVARHLREETTAYLRQEAKSFAMAMLERLDLLGDELVDLAAAPPGPPATARGTSSFTAAGRVAADGRGSFLVGSDEPPEVPPAIRARLRSARPALLVAALPGSVAQVTVLVPDGAGGYLWGIVRPQELWKRGSTIPPQVELGLMTTGGVELLGSGGVPAEIEADIVHRWAQQSSGAFTWKGADGEYLATFWTIPMAGNYGTDNWVVSLHQPRAEALAPVGEFATTFLWVVLLSLLAVVIAASSVIRRSLVPLGQLLEATRRVAGQDFTVALPPAPADELGELSVAFSQMAAQLRQHFDRLAAVAHQLEEERARLAGLVEHSPYGVVLVHGEGHVEFTNTLARGYLHQLGVGRSGELHELGGTTLAELAERGDWQELQVDAGGERTYVVAVRALVAAAGSPGAPCDHFVVLRDITEDRDVERQLHQQERLASVGQLAAGMAHDLNNVLQGIGMCADLLRPELSSQAARDDLNTLQRLHERAASLIRQVLDFSRLSDSAPRPMLLVPAVEEVVVLLERTLPATIRLRLAAAADTRDVVVSFDPGQLHQVLANLAVNARDAMPTGGVLEIAVRRAPPPSGRGDGSVCIAVRDSGTGIPVGLQARVFDPFFTTKPVGQGTGLGLSQVYGIVTQHGGIVDLESQPGVGTEVRVVLPVLLAGALSEGTAAAALPAPVAASKSARAAAAGIARVLVVDDEPAVLTLVERYLRGLGLEVTTAGSGREAIERLDGAPAFDLVLCDVVMPEGGGRDVLREVRRRAPGTRVVLMSGYTGVELGGEPGTVQADGWLQKPFAVDELQEIVTGVLGAARSGAAGRS